MDQFLHLAEFSESQWPRIVCYVAFSVEMAFFMNGMLEFVCAQSPYNVRGLLAGYTLLSFFFSFSLGVLIFWLFFSLCDKTYSFLSQSSFSTAVGLVGFILHCVLARWYKRRVRDEDYSPHRVVEEVYDRYLSQAHTVCAH